MITFKHYRSGDLYGLQYWFGAVGDALPEHAHDATMVHNVIVLAGAVDVTFPDDVRHLEAGVVFDFDGTRRHRIIATVPAMILNLYLNGMPEGYDRLPAHELEGIMK